MEDNNRKLLGKENGSDHYTAARYKSLHPPPPPPPPPFNPLTIPYQVIQPGQVPIGAMPYSSCIVLSSLNGFMIGSVFGSVMQISILPASPKSMFLPLLNSPGMRGRLAMGAFCGVQMGAVYTAMQLSMLVTEKARNKNDRWNALPAVAVLAGLCAKNWKAERALPALPASESLPPKPKLKASQPPVPPHVARQMAGQAKKSGRRALHSLAQLPKLPTTAPRPTLALLALLTVIETSPLVS
jgi:hypothetical protein